MTIGEAIRDIDAFGKEDSLFGIRTTAVWQATDECLVITEPIDVTKIESDGETWRYFLEVDVIRQVIEGRDDICSQRASEEDNVRTVIYYAMHDSWPRP